MRCKILIKILHKIQIEGKNKLDQDAHEDEDN